MGPPGEPGERGERGERGPQGLRGEPGNSLDGTFISVKLSDALYDENGGITISDSRITPERYRGIFIGLIPEEEFGGEDEAGYFPLDHLFSDNLFVMVGNGGVFISDPDQLLLGFALTFTLLFIEDIDEVTLSILIVI